MEEHLRQAVNSLEEIGEAKVANVIHAKDCENLYIGPTINITVKTKDPTIGNRLSVYPPDHITTNDHSFLTIITRDQWKAQPCVEELDLLEIPVKYVIIGHAGVKECFTQKENELSMSDMQSYHIHIRRWADIAYNFCIGSDGNIYEGRGWRFHGSHTLSWNHHSIGIAFIGTFFDTLPPKIAIENCQRLIDYGVAKGVISPNYELVGQCQCRVSFTSPGTRLFEEISTWKNFNSHL